MAEAARRHWGTLTRWSRWSALTGVTSCDAMLPRDAGLQHVCTACERHHRACVHALTITHTCPRSSAEAAAPRTSGWRCRRRNHSSEGRTGRGFDVHEGHLQAWRPRPAAAATATIVACEHAPAACEHAPEGAPNIASSKKRGHVGIFIREQTRRKT